MRLYRSMVESEAFEDKPLSETEFVGLPVHVIDHYRSLLGSSSPVQVLPGVRIQPAVGAKAQTSSG